MAESQCLRSGCPLSNLSVSLRSTRPGCGSQRLLRCRLHPAGRGPNSSSLFPPLAAVVAVAPGRGASGEEARLSGMPRPPLGRGGGTASAVTERLSPAKASRPGRPSSNLSVCFADSSPGRGASGEEAKLCGMPKPPLVRGGGTASAVTERLSPAEAFRVSLHLTITYYSSHDEYRHQFIITVWRCGIKSQTVNFIKK